MISAIDAISGRIKADNMGFISFPDDQLFIACITPGALPHFINHIAQVNVFKIAFGYFIEL
jgi:hypothetical protein